MATIRYTHPDYSHLSQERLEAFTKGIVEVFEGISIEEYSDAFAPTPEEMAEDTARYNAARALSDDEWEEMHEEALERSIRKAA